MAILKRMAKSAHKKTISKLLSFLLVMQGNYIDKLFSFHETMDFILNIQKFITFFLKYAYFLKFEECYQLEPMEKMNFCGGQTHSQMWCACLTLQCLAKRQSKRNIINLHRNKQQIKVITNNSGLTVLMNLH